MSDHPMPLVSVVTPVYNGERYLEQCIRSVLHQTYTHWEYILLNNSSTDRTLEIARHYAAKDNRIRVYNTPSLLPIMDNWNRALSFISPESVYCKVVHADDLLFSSCLETMVSVARAHPTIGMVGSYGYWGDRVVCQGLPEKTEFLPGRELCRLTLLDKVNCFWSPSSLLIRSDIIRKRKKYYGSHHLHADVRACYETLKESDFGFAHKILTLIRRHEDSVTSTVAAPLNRFIVDNLDHLLTFGPMFLDKNEFYRQVKFKEKQYFRFLANAAFRSRNKDFWDFHAKAIGDLGLEKRLPKLAYTLLATFLTAPRKSSSQFIQSLRTSTP